MENSPESRPHGSKWPNKARKRILQPMRLHPTPSQPLATHMTPPRPHFTQNLAPFLANSGKIPTFRRKAISSHRVGMAKPVTGKL